MSMNTDYDYLNPLERLQSQQAQTAAVELAEAAKAVKEEGNDTAAAAFAAALKKEIDSLQQDGGLGSVLSGASVMGSTVNLSDISEMLKSESGRRAINAMADNAITSIVLKDSDDSGSNAASALDALTNQDQSSAQELEDALKDVLEILQSSGGAEQTK